MPFRLPTHAHLIGIGGINMSGVAKLLVHAGVAVSGSDVQRSEFTDELKKKGVAIKIGHDKHNVPAETDLVIYSSAVPENNPERAEARHRGLRQLTNFQFLGEWTADQHTILVCGTHGKSTTTALAGLMLIEGGINPTVIVGSKVPVFKEGNIFVGPSDVVVIEGDEYAKHFLEFHPSAVILNNIELDHTDVFPDLSAMIETFRELLMRVQPKGLIVANADDPNIQTLVGQERSRLEAKGIRIKTFGFGSHADFQAADVVVRNEAQHFTLRDERGLVTRLSANVPGRMNVMNATGAATLALALGVPMEAIRQTLESFTGIWRRFQKISEREKTLVISDYGHHPTAVRSTLEAAKSFYPERRIVLCFQPHHRNRTKNLFLDFVSSFDRADALVLAEIYDVAGRDEREDENISSQDLRDAIIHHDADRGIRRPVEFAANPEGALVILKQWRKSGDVILVVGAGDIYQIVNNVLE